MPYGGNPSTDINDAIRFLIGDTNPSSPLLSDDELQWLRDTFGDNTFRVAAEAAAALAGRFALLCDQTVGKVSVSYSQKVQQYKTLEASLRARASSGAKAYFGGVSQADVDLEKEDDDRPQPAFYEGQFRNDYDQERDEVLDG